MGSGVYVGNPCSVLQRKRYAVEALYKYYTYGEDKDTDKKQLYWPVPCKEF